jgi:hypothetical protein
MSKQYTLKDIAYKAKALEKSIKDSHKFIERAQKKSSNNGKDKSLLHAACALGYIVNNAPITRDGNRYVNPMTSGEKLFLEEMGTYKCIEFKNNEFRDCNNQLVCIPSYKA